MTTWHVCTRSSGRICSSSAARSVRISTSTGICCIARPRSVGRPSVPSPVSSVRRSPLRRAFSSEASTMPSPRSKLPRVGTTIFTVMSRRARELNAINLGQGFPDYDIDPRLSELVHEAMRSGFNQYAPMPGLPELREAIAAKLARSYGAQFDPELELTVTLGATEAIFSTVQALVGPGDEVVVFDPAYDSYEPAIEL